MSAACDAFLLREAVGEGGGESAVSLSRGPEPAEGGEVTGSWRGDQALARQSWQADRMYKTVPVKKRY